MKKELLTISAALMLLHTPAAAQNCSVPPTCESLGYSKTATACAGLDILRCPFDNTKVFCTQGYKVQAAIGDILFSDMTTSSNPITGKTPIGIVFDTSQRLAMALTNKTSSLYIGQYSTQIFHFSPTCNAGYTLTKDLTNSLTVNAVYYNADTNEDGKKNTQLMATYIANYKTATSKAAEDFITPLRTAVQSGLDTYIEEIRESCSGCSENDIQNQARTNQNRDLSQISSLYAGINNYLNASVYNVDNPFKEALEYKTDGTNAGDWFIPSQSQLELIGMNINLILDSLRKINQTFSGGERYFMSSTFSGTNIQGIEFGYYCSTSDIKQQCTYKNKSIYPSAGSYVQSNYFPVINF